MRASYHDELEGVLQRIFEMAGLVETAILQASEGLLNADLAQAEAVISQDAQLDAMHEELEFRCLSLLALQAPVASELRTIVSAIRVIFELARMGDLAAHIGKIARLRYPNHALSTQLEDNFSQMANIATEMAGLAKAILMDRDPKQAERMVEIDATMDELRREHFEALMSEDWNGGTELTVDVALLGRYYERFADHAVAVARRVIYIATGTTPEGEDWPNA
ncbi:MAG: phosphate signaling complex protein PhoU [Arachnia sp.]